MSRTWNNLKLHFKVLWTLIQYHFMCLVTSKNIGDVNADVIKELGEKNITQDQYDWMLATARFHFTLRASYFIMITSPVVQNMWLSWIWFIKVWSLILLTPVIFLYCYVLIRKLFR